MKGYTHAAINFATDGNAYVFPYTGELTEFKAQRMIETLYERLKGQAISITPAKALELIKKTARLTVGRVYVRRDASGQTVWIALEGVLSELVKQKRFEDTRVLIEAVPEDLTDIEPGNAQTRFMCQPLKGKMSHQTNKPQEVSR